MITVLDASVDEVLAACRGLVDGRSGGAGRASTASTASTASLASATSAAFAASTVGATSAGAAGRTEVEAAEQLVDASDREAAARRRRPADARRTLAGRVALRLLVTARLGVPASLASQVTVDRTCRTCGEPHGQPRVAGLSVSTSGSDGRVLVAVADKGIEVGVDIERVPGSVFDGFDDVALHPDEKQHFAEVAPGAGVAARLTCWVEKEAVLKAAGVGLASPLHQLLVARVPDDYALPSRADMIGPWEWRAVLQAGTPDAVGLAVSELPTHRGYRSAVAARVPTRIHAVDLGSVAGGVAEVQLG